MRPDPEARAEDPVSLRRFVGYFLGLGTWGFGGPIATVGYMQRDLVERRGWVPREEFLNGVALGQTMPGPLAAQVVMWIGYLQAGALGALATVLPFILPSFVLVLGVAVAYVQFKGLEAIQALFYGIAPAVMAVLALASVKLARLTNGHDVRLWVITVVIAVVTAATGTEIALLVVAAGLLMMVWEAPPRWLGGRGVPVVAIPATHSLLTGTLAAGGLVTLGLFFLKAGAFIFGSGLAIVPFLRSGVVEQHHWLTATQFLDAVAIGLITPGPVVITATFIGYVAGGSRGPPSRPLPSSCRSTWGWSCRGGGSCGTGTTRACGGSSRGRPRRRPARSPGPRWCSRRGDRRLADRRHRRRLAGLPAALQEPGAGARAPGRPRGPRAAPAGRVMGSGRDVPASGGRRTTAPEMGYERETRAGRGRAARRKGVPMADLNLNNVMIGSSQPKVVGEFYTKVLDRPADMQDDGWYGWRVGSSWLSVGEHSEVKDQAKEPQRVILNFETKQVQEEFERIKAAGATVVKEPYELQGMSIATFADPDGNYFQLMSPWEDSQNQTS